MQTRKTIRPRSWERENGPTVVWLEGSPLNDVGSRTFLVSLAEGEPPIGKIVGFESRKEGNRRIRNPSRYTKVQELWTFALIGEPASYYTKLDSQSDALRRLILAHEHKQKERT